MNKQQAKQIVENYIRKQVCGMLKEEKENYIGINQKKPLIKALDTAERIMREYTKGNLKKEIMDSFNFLYKVANNEIGSNK